MSKLFGIILAVNIVTINAFAMKMDEWIAKQKVVAEQKILANISPKGVLIGTVLASPSKVDPDYYYHWVRDASLTMLAVQELGLANSELLLKNYLIATQIHQAKSGDQNLGEPKYFANGEPFTGPWGRPQNDGPALRAIVFANWAEKLLNQKQEAYVRRNLYDGNWPSVSVLKRDLEYVANHWSEPSYDLWEEIKADHFYTLIVQRRALTLGAEIALRLKDQWAAQFYLAQAALIKTKLQKFIVNQKIIPTLNYVEGLSTKKSNRDTAVLLGLLHGGLEDGFLAFNSTIVSETVLDLQTTFKNLYAINSKGPKGLAMGRYPEDTYYGGHAWFLTTLAQAEVLYKAGAFALAELVMSRVQFHVPADLRLTEQFDKNSGFCLGASDLTWSYASFLTTIQAREAALAALVRSQAQKSTNLPKHLVR